MEENKRKRVALTKPKTSEKVNTIFPLIPCELVEEILWKLPVKSLVRFRSVSKQWSSTVESQEFIEKHLIHQKSREPKILITKPKIYGSATPVYAIAESLITSVSLEDEEEICCSYTHSNRDLRYPSQVFSSCDGLVCVRGESSISIINPSTREVRKLPSMIRPERSDYVDAYRASGFGRDNVTGTLKVVQICNYFHKFGGKSTVCMVFALNADAWRRTSFVFHKIHHQKPVYVHGSLWFIGEPRKHADPEILAFDLHTEEFRVVPNPSGCSKRSISRRRMFSLRDRLCISEYNPPSYYIWGMDTHKRWEKMYSINAHKILDFPMDCQSFTPLTVCKTGRIVISENGRRLSTYCPETESFRLVCTESGVMAPYFESLVSTFQ